MPAIIGYSHIVPLSATYSRSRASPATRTVAAGCVVPSSVAPAARRNVTTGNAHADGDRKGHRARGKALSYRHIDPPHLVRPDAPSVSCWIPTNHFRRTFYAALAAAGCVAPVCRKCTIDDLAQRFYGCFAVVGKTVD